MMSSGRKRSATSSSIFTGPSLGTVDSVSLQITSVHSNSANRYPNVLLNRYWWPEIQVGDVLELRSSQKDHPCIFIIDSNDPTNLPTSVQVSVSHDISECFGFSSGMDVTIFKASREDFAADFVEIFFRDQYLGRGDMWRLTKSLVGQCWHVNQHVPFVGTADARIKNILNRGKSVKTAYVSSTTKVVYRSLTAKCTIFIQVCRELWDFADDGERYYEKIVHSFLPTLFKRWKELSTKHVVTIVLISRVFYESSEVSYAAGPVRQDEEGRDYKDFYRVITDIEVIQDWKPTLNVLKEAFFAFQRDILLTHHYHRTEGKEGEVPRLVGHISYAHEGPILEALNLGLNPTETHYIDRSLSLTGSSTILITPGRGHFRVSKRLLKLTTTRLLDQGFGLDIVSVGKAPLHVTPLFSFWGQDPAQYNKEHISEPQAGREYDVLWGGPAEDPGFKPTVDGRTPLYWQPFWISMMFWDTQMDLPFRLDKFIPRARMPQFEMMGLLHYDLISSITIPALESATYDLKTVEGRDRFDQDAFTCASATSSPSISAPESPTQIRGSVTKASVSNISRLKPSPLRRTSSATSLSTANKFGKQTKTEVPEDGPSSKRARPSSAHFDESLKERLQGMIPGTSPKERRITMLMQSEQVGRRSRTSSQSLAAGEVSVGSSLGRRVSASSRAHSPTRSRRNSAFGVIQPRSRQNSTIATVSAIPSLVTQPIPEQVDTSSSISGPVQQPDKRPSGLTPFARLTTSWLFTTWRTNPVPSKQNGNIPEEPEKLAINQALDTQGTSQQIAPQPISIKEQPPKRTARRNDDESNLAPGHRNSSTRNSPISTSPAAGTPGIGPSLGASAGSGFLPPLINPSATNVPVLQTQSSLARRWEHIYTAPMFESQIKWKSMVAPGCLPLTTEYFPSEEELETTYRVHSYETTLGAEMNESFLVKRPGGDSIHEEDWGLAIMRVMIALRLAQGFQFVIRPSDRARVEGGAQTTEGPADILKDVEAPVYLSMSDQIHKLRYDPTGPSIRVERYVRKAPSLPGPIPYQCLIWPKLGGGYTECMTEFSPPELELYGWNRLDMLAFGYENQFSESLRYWRTRFIVIPAEKSPEARLSTRGGRPFSDEEQQLIGMDRLADHFTKARWLRHGETLDSYPPVKFLLTTLDPVNSVLDEVLMSKLEDLHLAGPLRKKPNSNRVLQDADLNTLAVLARQPDGLPIRDNRWHHAFYPDSFTGEEFVSWLLREFQDVSNRDEGASWGAKLEQKGFLRHCRNYHGFIDGNYFYTLKGPYATQKPSLLSKSVRYLRNEPGGGQNSGQPNGSPSPRNEASPSSPLKKRRILSQSMIIDMDPLRRSEQSETAILHHDIIQNPGSAFHFQLHWIGSSAKFIDDMIQRWSQSIERFGLKLVESYVDQITNITKTNVFQSCFPIKFAVPPPKVPDTELLEPDYFEAALLREFGFVPDITGSSKYPDTVDVFYSYRTVSFTYSQWVHKSGLAFVQILDNGNGYSWLTNRLATTRSPAPGEKPIDVEKPNRLMDKLNTFCSDAQELEVFWENALQALNKRNEPAQLPVV